MVNPALTSVESHPPFLSVCSPLASSADGILKATGVRADEPLVENVPGDKADNPVVARESLLLRMDT